VFLTSSPGYVPTALLRNLEGNKVAHEQVLVLSFEIARVPRQDAANRVRIESLRDDIHLVRAIFGFMETPDVGETLKACRRRGLQVYIEDCTFFLGWHLVHARRREGWEGIRRRLFAWMQRRSTQAAEFFRMPSRGVVILATDVEI
jgi:KUP system potassium uptake protein